MMWFNCLQLCVVVVCIHGMPTTTDLLETVEDITATEPDATTTEVIFNSSITRDPKSYTSTSDQATDGTSTSDLPTAQLMSMQLHTNRPSLQCGRRYVRDGRIVGGQDTYEGEFPWAVSVRLLTTHYCGGTIINNFWILTAAHCVKRYNSRYFRVRPGGKEVHLDQHHPEWDIYVDEVSVHPEFGKPRRYSNDLALLKLRHPVTFGELAQPICLPKNLDEDYEGRNGTVVGWGWLNEVEKGKSKLLQKVQVPILNNTICAKWYSEEYDGYVQIQEYQICAGYKEGGKDACQGDSGGPLVMKDGDHFNLIGVVSAGVGCARQHLPGIYSRVSVFVPWILEVTGGLHGL